MSGLNVGAMFREQAASADRTIKVLDELDRLRVRDEARRLFDAEQRGPGDPLHCSGRCPGPCQTCYGGAVLVRAGTPLCEACGNVARQRATVDRMRARRR